MKFKFGAIFLGMFGVCIYRAFAQITAPGMDDTRAALWTAVGIRQDVDSSAKIHSFTYIGYGRKSPPDAYNLAEKAALWVFNQEFYYRMAKRWQLSGALSYRIQSEYEAMAPPFRQEVRIYARSAYLVEKNRFRINFVFRPETRFYFTPDFEKWESESVQLRARLKAQARYNITQKGNRRLTAGVEALATSGLGSGTKWSAWTYRETRTALHYTHALSKPDLLISLGFHTYFAIVSHGINISNILGLDLVFQNPFGKLGKRKPLKTPDDVETNQ